MYDTSALIPNLSIAASVSPPPATENAGDLAIASEMPLYPLQSFEFEYAYWAVPKNGFRVCDDFRQCSR